MKKYPIDKYLIIPVSQFINKTTTSGLVLFISAVAALIVANSPYAEAYHHFWEHKISLSFDGYSISENLHHWINDGLMAIFFFVVGLELKREVLAGELSNPKDAILPLAAGFGGMVVPAIIYLAFNTQGSSADGWGIPMATDIAFALGIIYLLGKKVPTSLKIFLTALAIADDLGAVLVIAFFYTSDISFLSLGLGAVFFTILLAGNLLGVRNTLFYAIFGIGGLWTAFLLSGVHATIAGVIAALAIPATVKIKSSSFTHKLKELTDEFKIAKKNNVSLVTNEELHVLEKIQFYTRSALTPLQKLEHALHPIVAFIVMPIFAFANAGVTFSGNFSESIFSNVSLGIFFGLVFGKFIGIVGVSKLLVKLKWATLPHETNWKHIYGAALLAGVGFTMSLFITELAFSNPVHILNAKIGIFMASGVSGLAGYYLLRNIK